MLALAQRRALAAADYMHALTHTRCDPPPQVHKANESFLGDEQSKQQLIMR